MANRPRKHHYNPVFYLRGFTEAGSEQARLYVFDQEQIKSWPSTPRNAGYQHDFYAVDLGSDVDPASFESDVLARLETEFSRVVRTSVANQTLPEGRDFDVLLNFIAVMATRLPRIRHLVGQVTDLVVKSVVQSLVATDEGWQQFRDSCRDAGISPDDADADELREFILSGEYTVDLDQTSHVQKIVELASAMLPVLAQRHWSLGIAASGVPDFVCSDAPVSLVPTDRFGKKDELHLANQHTLIALPLTRRAALLGSYQKRERFFQINEFGVLSINARTIIEARQIFSAEEDFTYCGIGNRRKRKSDLEESLRRGGKYSHLAESVDRWFQTKWRRRTSSP